MQRNAQMLFSQSVVKAKKQSKKPATLTWRQKLPAQQYQSLRQTFLIFDIDSSGTIDPTQITKVFQQLDLTSRNPFIQMILISIRQKNKPINFEQFVDCVCSRVGQYRTRDGLKRIFQFYDREGQDRIGFQELKLIARTIGENMDDQALLEMMHSTFIKHNTHSNQGFNFQEFYMVVSKFYARKEK